MSDIDQIDVDDKKRELLFETMNRNNFGMPYLHEVLGEDAKLMAMVTCLFDENLTNDDCLALIDNIRHQAIKYLGDKYETKCQEAVSADMSAHDEYMREMAQEMRAA